MRANASREERLLLLSLVVPFIAWALYYIHRTSFVIEGRRFYCLWDDAMISMRYAANLANGHGLVWNPGQDPVQGFSNPGITLVMALLHALPFSAATVSLAFQLCGLVLVVAILVIAFRLALSSSADLMVAGTTGLALAVCAPVAVWGLQGADTAAVGAWLLVAVAWQQRAARARRPWPDGLFLWLGAGALLRLDTLAFTGVFLVLSTLSPRAGLRDVARRLAGSAAISLGLLGFGLYYYGDPLPNTVYLKATGSPLSLVLYSGLTQLAAWWNLAPALALAMFAIRQHRRDPTFVLCGLLIAIALAYDLLVGGDWLASYGSRFVVPVLPLVLLLAVRGAFDAFGAWERAGRVSASSALLGSITLAVVASFLANPGGAILEWTDPGAETMYREQNSYNARLGLYLKEQTHPDTLVALHWAGVPGFFSERPALDVLGRSDRHIARLEARVFVPGHSKWDWDYVLGRRPDVFLLESRGLADREDFRRDYWRVETPGGLEFFLRKASADRLLDGDVARFEQGLPEDAARGRPERE